MGQTQNLGIVAPVPKGSWTASQSYDRLNIVRHGNASYIAIVANIAVEPAVTQRWENSWMLLASDGSQTPSGANDYNLLENQPIFNVDLTTLATPVVNEYYRHIGATTNQFINDCIYRYNGTQFIILGDLDKSIADKTYSNALKGYAGGSAIRLDDVSPLQSDVEVQVNGVDNPESVQVKRYGKNLCNPDFLTNGKPSILTETGFERDGVTFRYLQDEDCFVINGSSTDNYGSQLTPNVYEFLSLKDVPLRASIQYVSGEITVDTNVSNSYQSGVYFATANEGEPPTQHSAAGNVLFQPKLSSNPSTSGIVRVNRAYLDGWFVVAKTGATFDNYKFRVQLELGDTVTEYEKATEETYTPDVNGNLKIPSISPTMTLLTNNANANLSATYNRDINAAINGTTETQPLATIDYVNTAIGNNKPKLYEHAFNGDIYTSAGVISFVFSMTSETETKLITEGSASQMFSAFFTLLRNRYGNNNVPNFNGYTVENIVGIIALAQFTNAANFTFFTEGTTVEKIINLSDIDSISIFNENIIEIL